MENSFYWYRGDKVSLLPNPKKEYLLFDSRYEPNSINIVLADFKGNLDFNKVQLGSIDPINEEFRSTDSKELYWTITDKTDSLTKDIPFVLYRGRGYLDKNEKELFLSHIFYVKLFKETDISILIEKANENKVFIEGKNKFMPLWFVLSCDKNSKGDSLEMANFFYETGLFEASEPDLLEDSLIQCANDTYFPDQWALRNTGQLGGTIGADIKLCETWTETQGNPSIIVAIVDQGLELNHPDFSNISSTSFDSESGTSPSQVLGSHGVAVAGIVGATANNNLGVAGVAPATTLMSISNSLAASPNSRMKRADGINFARTNGASIITNSWGSAVPYQIIDDAIDFAVNYGRGGLGCVVLFATGNDFAGTISYPSNRPNVIAVGATDRWDSRCDFSNHGIGLTIAAPGDEIYTTDRQGTNGYNTSASPIGDYFEGFNGTSAATPHVAGVAALMLAVNNSLTFKQVTDILKANADKVGGYTYDATGWSDELGHGRLNAYKSVLAAKYSIIGINQFCTTATYQINNLPAGATVSWNASPIVSIITSGTYNEIANATRLFDGVARLQATVTIGGVAFKLLEKIALAGAPTPNSGRLLIINNGGPPNNPTHLYPCIFDGTAQFLYVDIFGNTSDMHDYFEFEVIPGSNYEFEPFRQDFEYHINPSFSGTLTVPVRIKNLCGWSAGEFYIDIIVPNC